MGSRRDWPVRGFAGAHPDRSGPSAARRPLAIAGHHVSGILGGRRGRDHRGCRMVGRDLQRPPACRQDLVPAAALDRSRRRPNHAPARLRGADLARVALCLRPAGAGRTDRRRATRAYLDTDVTRAGGERMAHTAARSITPARHRPLPHLSAATATGANAGSRPAPAPGAIGVAVVSNLLRGGYLLPQIFSRWAVSPPP